MKFIKKLSLVFLSTILAVSLIGCQSTNNEDVQKKFNEFIQTQFVKTMESDYTTAHTFMVNPKNFGVDMSKVNVNLGNRITEENIKKSKEDNLSALKELKSFDRDVLTDDQKDTYDIYKYQTELEEKLNDDKFDYYQQIFESMTGIHYQLPTTLADWQLRNEQDVKNLVTVVNDIKPYIDSALDYTKKQEEKGLLMVDLNEVIAYCDKIIKKGDQSAVLEAMKKSIDELSLEKGSEYKKQLSQAFKDSFIPAYEDIRDTMKSFKSGTNNTEGYAKFKNGKEYYELLLQKNIGSNKSVSDIRTMMTKAYNNHLKNLMAVAAKNPNINQSEPKTNYKNYTEMLDDIQKNLFNDFPEVKNTSYHIEDINKEIASSSGVAAYFNIPPLDGTEKKQLRVNPNSADVSTVSTYHTVAHEGFPGHMYQYAYMYENISSPYRKALANSSAYSEGYAVYAQYYAFNYLTDIDQNYLELTKENELATYCIIILADIGIHYEGWSFEQFKDFLNAKGLTLEDDEQFKNQYYQLQANPSAFQPYYVGYEEIIALKENAEDKLGTKFKDKDFHTALLKSGTAPFSVVERNIDAYIEQNK
ncbi:DUF885 domain-containing protein [Candidatus Stoquefichus massiliensis]|uniref:DUF885 domain-containing protein n=1 Tax=Candidatus Stoquefichus massiliensis TaxID=1470350 RepID=UPI000489F9D3|nr:DUF885 domain-containing protein [Candidatus Stoquefichus massiliensis]